MLPCILHCRNMPLRQEGWKEHTCPPLQMHCSRGPSILIEPWRLRCSGSASRGLHSASNAVLAACESSEGSTLNFCIQVFSLTKTPCSCLNSPPISGCSKFIAASMIAASTSSRVMSALTASLAASSMFCKREHSSDANYHYHCNLAMLTSPLHKLKRQASFSLALYGLQDHAAASSASSLHGRSQLQTLQRGFGQK
jgi:hypothetical protein